MRKNCINVVEKVTYRKDAGKKCFDFDLTSAGVSYCGGRSSHRREILITGYLREETVSAPFC